MKAIVIETGEIVEVYREPQHGQVSSIFKEAVFVNGRMWEEDELDFCIEAEEFPEKIYTYGGEYIRTDAFIEKVARFLEYKLNDRVEIRVPSTLIPSVTDKETFIEEVKKYMKGE